MKKFFVASAIAGLMALTAAGAAAAAPQWKTFGTGTWRPHLGFNSQHALVTTSDPSGTYGGIYLLNGETDPASVDAISYEFNASETGNSGGSPRLVVVFSDGGRGELRPLAWTADTWTHVEGMTGNLWDNNGGTCGYVFGTTWAAVMACHAGASITDTFAVNDSGWMYSPDGETVLLDDITFDSAIAAGPGRSR